MATTPFIQTATITRKVPQKWCLKIVATLCDVLELIVARTWDLNYKLELNFELVPMRIQAWTLVWKCYCTTDKLVYTMTHTNKHKYTQAHTCTHKHIAHMHTHTYTCCAQHAHTHLHTHTQSHPCATSFPIAAVSQTEVKLIKSQLCHDSVMANNGARQTHTDRTICLVSSELIPVQ